MVRPHDADELSAPLLGASQQGAGQTQLPRAMSFEYDGEELDAGRFKVGHLEECEEEEDAEAHGLVARQSSHTHAHARHSHGHSHSHPSGTHARSSVHDAPASGTFLWTVMQLSKVIMGSGMLVLPRAFQLLGVGLATGLLALVGLITWFTIAGLIYASEMDGKHTYAAVVRLSLGRPAKWGLLAAVFTNCLGMLVVFMVVYVDILVGSAPEYNGLVLELFPGLRGSALVTDRGSVLAVVAVCILLPMVVTRDLGKLGPLALAGVGSVILFALTTVGLAGAALVQGKQAPLPWLPDWEGLANGASNSGGGGGGGSTASIAAIVFGISAVVPLLLGADICHQSVFPVSHLLVPYSRKSFNLVTGVSLTLCNLLYTLIAMCCLLVFGANLDSNVLNNMTADHMIELIGPWPATWISALVRVTYLISMLGSYVFTLHPLRFCVMEVMLGSNFVTKKQDKADRLFLPITLVLLATSYTIAVFTPGIWVVMSLVGSISSTFMGFVFPALVILVTARKPKWQHTVKRSVAVVVAVIGLYLFGNGIVIQVLNTSGSP